MEEVANCKMLLSALVAQIVAEKISIEGLIPLIEELQEQDKMNAIALGMLMLAIRDA